MPAKESSTSSENVSVEEYEKIRAKVRDLVSKKKATDKALNNVEEQIFRAEGAYLEETSSGNIVKGYENYIKGSQTKKRVLLNEQDRVFSLSSAVFIKTKIKEEEEKNI